MTRSKQLTPRLQRESRTIVRMIELYCRAHHHSSDSANQLCSECETLKAYCLRRVERCVYGTEKPVCSQCPIHCYKKEPREQIRVIMRWAGPRMLWHHPILAIRHLLDERRPVPPRPGKQTRR